MRNVLFENRWGALGFVALIALSAAVLVGDESGEGLLGRAADAADASDEDAPVRSIDLARPEMPSAELMQSRPETAEVAHDRSSFFADDEELIDDATGFDPNPLVTPTGSNPAELDPALAEPQGQGMLAPDGGETFGE